MKKPTIGKPVTNNELAERTVELQGRISSLADIAMSAIEIVEAQIELLSDEIRELQNRLPARLVKPRRKNGK